MPWGRWFKREGGDMTEPIVDYSLRAANRPRPSIWVEPDESLNLFAHTRDEGTLYAATGQTYFADVSVYQPVVDDTYPYPVFGFRADSGNSTDGHAAANWRYSDSHPDHIRVAIPYVIFKPGQSGAIFTRLKNLFGAQCPPQIVPEIDMESGSDFAGPGNHSSEANGFIATLAAWSGDQKQTQGYANSPDWSGNWPTPPAWMKKRLAYYSSNPTPPGYYSRQYYGALPYSSPAGYPRTCAPFGSYVDMNVTPRTITQIEADYGITAAPEADMTPDEHAMLVAIANAVKLDTTHPGVPSLGDVWRLAEADTNDTVHAWTNAAIAANVKELQDQVTVLQQAVAKLGTGTGGAVTKADVLAIINSTKLNSAG
jgi:hypothetical protein